MVNRRTFLQHAGSFATAAVVLPVLPSSEARRYKIGLQLFTVNRAMNQDAAGTIPRAAAMGYEEVETYGLDPAALTYYGMPARDFAKRLQDQDLTTPSGHYDLQRFLNDPIDDLNRYVDRCAEGARILGQRYVTWPFLEPAKRTLDTYKPVAERLKVIGARLAKAGLHAAYHNGSSSRAATSPSTRCRVLKTASRTSNATCRGSGACAPPPLSDTISAEAP